MNDEMRRFMAKTNPKFLNTAIDKARYGTLDDCLSIGEIAELWGKNGLLKGSREWKTVVDYLVGLVKSGMLVCENMDIAFGKVDKSKADYNQILLTFSHGAVGYEKVNYDPSEAPIKRDSLKDFFDKNDGLDLIDDFLIRRWWPADVKGGAEVEINPNHVNSPRNLERDRLALALLKDQPDLKYKIRSEVKNELEKYNRIFKIGFKNWWDSQIIFDKISKGGRPKNKQPKT